MIRTGTADTPAWRDRSRPTAERAEDLLSRMTLEEKVASGQRLDGKVAA